jgi:hypothetical protein
LHHRGIAGDCCFMKILMLACAAIATVSGFVFFINSFSCELKRSDLSAAYLGVALWAFNYFCERLRHK